MNIKNIIDSFLAGGIAAALVTLIFNALRERKRRKIDFVQSQLRELYGPLQFFTSWNTQLIELSNKVHEIYKQEYIGSNIESSSQRAEQVLEIANQYIRQTTQNNDIILEILRDHYDLIEPEDIDVCTQFREHYTRMKVERNEGGHFNAPEIQEYLGNISCMPKEFIDAVNDRFKEKKKELKNLLEKWLRF